MRKHQRRIAQFPALLVFLSFLFGLANFIDTSFRLIYTYMLSGSYPLGTDLKPLLFLLQATCLILFIYHTAVHNKSSVPVGSLGSLLKLQLFVAFTIISLFFLYELGIPARYGVIYYAEAVWLLSFILGSVFVCFWFFSKLFKEPSYRSFSVVFLLVGLGFVSRVISEVYFWPQTFLNLSLPSEVDLGSRLSTTLLVLFALFYTLALLWYRRTSEKTPASILKRPQVYVVLLAFLLPLFMNSYKEGLFSLIVRTTVYWGLSYSGQDWYFSSLYLAALAAYVFVIVDLAKRLDHSLGSSLILLSVMAFPWSGITVYDPVGYSSIPGNLLALSGLIVGFFMGRESPKKLNVALDTESGL